MAKVLGRNSSVVKYHMYSRLGKALKFQHRLVINSGVRQEKEHSRKVRTKNHINFAFKTPEKSLIKRPTSSFAVVDREHVFYKFQPVRL